MATILIISNFAETDRSVGRSSVRPILKEAEADLIRREPALHYAEMKPGSLATPDNHWAKVEISRLWVPRWKIGRAAADNLQEEALIN